MRTVTPDLSRSPTSRLPRLSAGRPSLAALIAMAVVGCGGDPGRLAVHPVQGRVAVLDQVPEGALVVLYPVPGNATELRPSGKVDRDGNFRLTTYDADDGAPAGDFVGTIRWNKVVKKGGDYAAGPNLVPEAYGAAATSPWKIRVEPAANRLPELKITK